MRSSSEYRVMLRIALTFLIFICLLGVANAIVIDLPYPVVSVSNSPYKFFGFETVVTVKNGNTYEIWGIDYNATDNTYSYYKIIYGLTSETWVTVGADGCLYFSIRGDGTYKLDKNLEITKITTVYGILTASEKGVLLVQCPPSSYVYYASYYVYLINYSTATETQLFKIPAVSYYGVIGVVGISADDNYIYAVYERDYESSIHLAVFDYQGNIISDYKKTRSSFAVDVAYGGVVSNNNEIFALIKIQNTAAGITLSFSIKAELKNGVLQNITSYTLGPYNYVQKLGCLAGTTIAYYIDANGDLTTFSSTASFGEVGEEKSPNIIIKGYVTDEQGNALSNVAINIKQGGLEYSLTTDLNGYYEANVLLLEGFLTTITASKSGYLSETRNITFYTAGTYIINFTLINISTNYTVYGIVKEYPLGNPVPNAVVTISNETWSASTIANTCGFYYFDYNLTDGKYTIQASKTNYEEATENIVLSNSTILRKDISIKPLHKLQIYAKTTQDYYLWEFKAQITDLDTSKNYLTDTTNGSVSLMLTAGWYSIVVLSNEYSGSVNIFLNEDRTVTVLVSKLPTSIPRQEVYYAPTHTVTLQVIKAGQVLAGVQVTIKDLTTGKIFNLTTDRYGSVVFWANKTRPYEININNGEKVLTLYPASDYYIVNIGGGFNISTNQTRLNFTNVTLPVPEWLKLPVEVFLLLGCCCLVLAGTKSNMPFALLMTTLLLGFGAWSGLTPHVPPPVVAVSAFVTGLSFLRRGEES